ncbi:carbon-nitrogen hydrolase [Xylaria curta]|nr:carbon-nitrogen hydrolase [Xylaria curta]
MRVGCLQFAPQVGDIDDNLNRADAVLNKANPENLDLLVLPELAFTGYNFKSLQQISPFLESRGSGISALWARTTALRLNCVVTVGYPEKVDVESKWPTSPEYYNSVIAVNSDGETIAHYRKAFLYYTDETWALEGPEGFYGGFIPELGTTTSMGICMDINPYKFEAPWLAFEFAFHCLEVEANLVILTMSWLTREDASLFCRTPNEPDMETLTYWISRLEPLIRSESQEEIVVVFCNRTGIEGDAVYAGTSAVIGVKDGEVNVYGILGRGEKDLLVVDTEKPPYAKVVYRPDDRFSQGTPVLDSASTLEGTGPIGSEQSAAAKPTPAQPSPKNISAETAEAAEANAAQYKARVSVSSEAGCAPAISKNPGDLASPKGVDDITSDNRQGKIARQKKARSLPTQILSLPATGTSPKDISPQSFTGSARSSSDTPLGTPTELRRRALARADSPTLSVDIPVTSQLIAQPRSVSSSCYADNKLSGQITACDAHDDDDNHKLLGATGLPNAPSFDSKSPSEMKTEIECDFLEWSDRESDRGTEDEDEIVEIVVRRSSSCLIHGRSQGNEFKTPERTSLQLEVADFRPLVFPAEEADLDRIISSTSRS